MYIYIHRVYLSLFAEGNMKNLLDNVWNVFYHFNNYKYIDGFLPNYHIKTKEEFDFSNGGICWDFIGPMHEMLLSKDIYHHCFFSEIQRSGAMIASHTYIIVNDLPYRYWLECAWQKHKGLFFISSYKDIERMLKDEYSSSEVHTVMYNPEMCYGKTADEFFEYLNKEGVDLP